MRKLTVKTSASRSPTLPIASTIEKVRGFNTLTIYKMSASKYYYARYYEDKKISRKCLKTEDKSDALKAAKEFFIHLKTRKMNNLPLSRKSGFIACAFELLKETEARATRGEISEKKAYADRLRITKDIEPFFKKHEAHEVDYTAISKFLNQLVEERELSSSSLLVYLSHIKTILKFAQKTNVISYLPHFPTVKIVDKPRSWFSSSEYNKLHNTALQHIGESKKVFEVDEKTGEQRPLRNITLSQELYDLILFMANTPIRPTDLRILKHKHIAIVRAPNQFLRLTHPPTKKHSSPVISMPSTIELYEKMRARHLAEGYEDIGETHLFQPQHPQNRDYALQQIHRQFDYLLEMTNLKTDNYGQSRTLYSLRHTAIMFRIVNSKNFNLITLARNARTSTEMIDRFYAKYLTAEMTANEYQSHKSEKMSELMEETRLRVKGRDSNSSQEHDES